MTKPRSKQYDAIAKLFHWLMAFAIITMLVMGFVMAGLPVSPDKFRVYGIHKSIGALILFTAFLRLFWRLKHPAPELPQTMPKWQIQAAHAGHALLYVLMFAMPLSGWLMSSAAGFPVSVFGWFTLPNLVSPDKELRVLFGAVHEFSAFALITILAGHVVAALKHHFIDKDDILRRMLPLLLLAFMAAPLHANDSLKRWYVVGDQSSLTFTVKQNDAPIKGAFSKFISGIFFSPDNLDKSVVRVQVDLKSVQMDYPQAQQAVQSPDWLDVEKSLIANFVSTKITHLAEKNYTAEGSLITHGVSVPVLLHFTVEEYAGAHAHIKGETTLSRNSFGIGRGEWKATDVVKDEVAVQFDIVAQDSPWFPLSRK